MTVTLQNILAAALLSTCSTLCSAETCHSLRAIDWLIGHWQAETEKTIIHETWSKVSANTFEALGETHARDHQQIIETETLRLLQMSGEIFYLAKVTHNTLPIAFKLQICEAKYLVFENPNHNFPTRIEYRLEKPDLLIARVSNDQDKSFKIEFHKTKP